MRYVSMFITFALLGSCSGRAAPPAASPAAQAPGDWVAYNGSLNGDRFSPLTEISTANVGELRQACTFDAPAAISFQSGIVAVHGTLYFTVARAVSSISEARKPPRFYGWRDSGPKRRLGVAARRSASGAPISVEHPRVRPIQKRRGPTRQPASGLLDLARPA